MAISLKKLNVIIPWPALAWPLNRSDGSKGGRPPFPAVLMFKILVLQALYSLSDNHAEFVIQDRPESRFLGLSVSDQVPDGRRDDLAVSLSFVRAGAIENLFARVDKHLLRSGYLSKGGQIVDATIIQAPNQRNSLEETETIKAGEIPQDWKHRPTKLVQKEQGCALDCEAFEVEASNGNADISANKDPSSCHFDV